ncbi:unnamed protein product [Ceratitis capitata]|nr:unnamed protein product [Ceratitis capitata]
MPNPAQVFVRHPGVTTLHRIPTQTVDEQLEPLALIAKKPTTNVVKVECEEAPAYASTKFASNNEASTSSAYVPKKQQASANSQMKFLANNNSAIDALPLALTANVQHYEALRQNRQLQQQQQHAPANTHATATITTAKAAPTSATQYYKPNSVADETPSGSGGAGSSASGSGSGSARPQQRNYKNMTRERRIEANARERTRVHTISAAYETLRHAVPSYSNAQKLSKLSVLRIACSYILTLSRMAGHDYSADGSEPTLADCFDAVTETIQTEGKIRKKKDE